MMILLKKLLRLQLLSNCYYLVVIVFLLGCSISFASGSTIMAATTSTGRHDQQQQQQQQIRTSTFHPLLHIQDPTVTAKGADSSTASAEQDPAATDLLPTLRHKSDNTGGNTVFVDAATSTEYDNQQLVTTGIRRVPAPRMLLSSGEQQQQQQTTEKDATINSSDQEETTTNLLGTVVAGGGSGDVDQQQQSSSIIGEEIMILNPLRELTENRITKEGRDDGDDSSSIYPKQQTAATLLSSSTTTKAAGDNYRDGTNKDQSDNSVMIGNVFSGRQSDTNGDDGSMNTGNNDNDNNDNNDNYYCTGPRTMGELKAYLLDNGKYDKQTRPGFAANLDKGYLSARLMRSTPPEMARIQLHVLSLNGIDQKRNEYQITAWFRRSWHDYRLAYENFDLQSDGNGCFPSSDSDPGFVAGYDGSLIDEIWHPDFYLINAAKPMEQTGDGVYLYPDGTVHWSSQVEITLQCSMDFSQFPYDTQECYFRMSTYRQDAKSVVLDFFTDRNPVTLAWEPTTSGSDNNPNDVADSAIHGKNPEWTIVSATHVTEQSGSGSIGLYSYATLKFRLERNPQYYEQFVLIPAIMFVVITWSSFFIDRSAAPARVAMTMIVFLANTNFLVAQLGQLPRLGNDVWLLRFLTMSTYFSFYGVLEYCLVNYLRRVHARLAEAKKKARAARRLQFEEDNCDDMSESEITKSLRRQDTAVVWDPGFVTKTELLATGFDCKVDLMIVNPTTGRMYVRDHHIDVLNRWTYPLCYAGAVCYLWFTVQS